MGRNVSAVREVVYLLTPATRLDPYSQRLVPDLTAPAEEVAVEAVVAPAGSTEGDAPDRAEVVTAFDVYLPRGTVLTARQGVRVRGEIHTVEGEPAVWPRGVVARVERTEG